ncbi:MAG: hypothetical protein EKK40_10035 [Bradyrhizobiaceae bacterium]|nr:MAG: hypothetical protein EKK40_10035 [Bradyrhizobiaceae bacterium]
MTGNRIIPHNNVVPFFAAQIEDMDDDALDHDNDNCCPHCGGIMLPGDKASDCSMAKAQPVSPCPHVL